MKGIGWSAAAALAAGCMCRKSAVCGIGNGAGE